MSKRILEVTIVALSLFLPIAATAQKTGSVPAPARARKIPGITVKDSFPRACVDCHTERPDWDARFSTLMGQWTKAVDPQLLSKAQGTSLEGLVLKGKHPPVAPMIKSIPASCLQCHGRESPIAPPFAQMVHRIHLVGGDKNRFLTLFQGECTHCHKLNDSTGRWTIPSEEEK
jgi:mono/diheme cytochrome c family protein